MTSITLYGAPISPFVRKARLALKYKDINYQLVPVIPVDDNLPAEFNANSPLGKIPLLHTGDTWLPDSSVICAWLEKRLAPLIGSPANGHSPKGWKTIRF